MESYTITYFLTMDKEEQKEFYKDITKLFLHGIKNDESTDYKQVIKKSYETTTENLSKSDKDFKDVEFKKFEKFCETEDEEFLSIIDNLIDSGVDIESMVLEYIKQFSQIDNAELIKNGFDPSGLQKVYDNMKEQFSAQKSNDRIIEL